MDDKTMLEWAAKAAGAVWVGHYNRWELNGKSWWPLEDDGDALRLAVKLHIHISPRPDHVEARFFDGAAWNCFKEKYQSD